MTPDQIEAWLYKRGSEESYYLFLNWVFKKVHQKPFIPNTHLEVLCGVMEKVFNGELTNVVITIPPRYSKTLCAVVAFIPWALTKKPWSNFLHLSYSEALALKNSLEACNIVTSPEYQALWGYSLAKSEQAKKMWRTTHGGGVYATNSGGAVTGFGAGVKGAEGFSGCILIDDPQKANDERHELSRKTIIENFENVISSRRNNPNTPIVLIQQRLHEEDLAGYLLSGKSSVGEFTHINMPALMEDEPTWYDKREIGEPLWAYQQTQQALLRIKKHNPVLFATQYQQRPSPAEGLLFKKKWVKYYTHRPDEFDFGEFVSVDMNMKEAGGSNAVMSRYGINRNSIYLLDQIAGKWGFPEAEERLKQFVKEPYRALLIEAKANGHAMMAKMEQDGYHGIIPVRVEGDKVYRFNEVSMLYAAGNVWYPHPSIAPWIHEHVHEMAVFNKGRYDDRVDAETQLLKHYLMELAGTTFWAV